ncbi:MAG: FtsX-like permease family protein [Spirochaetia bacterium]|nr:FtsX-like permease family protein [Spirochaetia bacterium]
MNVSLKKSWNDLKIHPARTILLVFALIIGFWGIGTILVSYSILNNDLNENYTRTKPAHVVLKSDNFDKLNLSEFISQSEIESAEFRDLSMQRIEVYPGKWLPLWLFGVEDFNNFNLAKFYKERGNKVPDSGTMLIERDGQNVRISNLKIGSKPNVRIGKKNINIPVTGIVFDPSQAPATQDAFIYGYTDKKTFQKIVGESANQRLIFRLNNVASKLQIEERTKKIINDFQKKGIVISEVVIPQYQEHPHQFQLNTLLMLNAAIGLLAFIMGAVLVSQLMSAILSQQIRQIGIIKAIGASKVQALKIYLVMVLIFGLASSIVAIPLSVISGYGYAEFVAANLNFNIITTSLPIPLYLLLVILGVFLPLLLSLPPILKGIRVSVHDAINDYGISQNTQSVKIGVLSSLPFSSNITLALRNSFRRKKRLMVTVFTMSLGVAIFSASFNVKRSLEVFLANSRDSMKHDVQVVLKEQAPLKTALEPFDNLNNIERMETWNGGKGRLQTDLISTPNGIGIVALPHNTDLVKWNLIAGRWLKPTVPIEIVMNQQAIEKFGKHTVGEFYPIKIKGKLINTKLVGIIKEFDSPKIYINKDQYDALVNPKHLVNSLMFVAGTKDYNSILELKKEIENAIAMSDLNILYVMSQAERAQIIYDHLNIILIILVFLAFLVLIVSALGMASATGINIIERVREIGVMRAIGATPRIIYNIFVTEGMLISGFSITLGLLMAAPMSYLASRFFGGLILGDNTSLDLTLSLSGLAITFFATFIFGWIASRVPARKAIQVSTREALSYE